MSSFEKIDLHAIARDAMERYGFLPYFPKRVIEEVDAIKEAEILARSRKQVKDLRQLLWSSIDNSDSLDLDQIEYCERGFNNEILVKVAVADVDLFVAKGSQADGYAAHNGTSVYTGIDTFSMLPERLSHGLTSLRPGDDHMAVVVEFAVLRNGSVRRGDVYRALVRNKAQLVYEVIGDWLDKKSSTPAAVQNVPGLEAQLHLQHAAADRLKNFRMERGALELESIEVKPVFQEETISGLIVPRENPARYIIENFMIAANGTVMEFLGKAGLPTIQRVVRVPKNWAGIREVALELGANLPGQPDPKALSKFLLKRKAADPVRFPDLSLTVIKLMGPGEYTMLEPGKPPIGHFGLAVMDYTHSTAPNRRYVDVIIQRLVKGILNRRPCPYSRKELIEHAAWCTDRDKMSKKVERFMQKVAAAIILDGRVGEIFDGIVTGASEKGTYVRLLDPPVEGRVVRGFERMEVGNTVRVKLTDLDPYQGHIDFVRVKAR
jgi:VacB/RNase II family 3'-5' exoribonuclease